MKDGIVLAAGLDVLPEEPANPQRRLVAAWQRNEDWIRHRLLLTPHSAFYTPESMRDNRGFAARTAARYLRDGRPGELRQQAVPGCAGAERPWRYSAAMLELLRCRAGRLAPCSAWRHSGDADAGSRWGPKAWSRVAAEVDEAWARKPNHDAFWAYRMLVRFIGEQRQGAGRGLRRGACLARVDRLRLPGHRHRSRPRTCCGGCGLVRKWPMR